MKRNRFLAFVLATILSATAVNFSVSAAYENKNETPFSETTTQNTSLLEIDKSDSSALYDDEIISPVGIKASADIFNEDIPVFTDTTVQEEKVGAALSLSPWKSAENNYVDSVVTSDAQFYSLYKAACNACDDYLYSTTDTDSSNVFAVAKASGNYVTKELAKKVYSCLMVNNPQYYWLDYKYAYSNNSIYLYTMYPSYADRAEYESSITEFINGWKSQVDLTAGDYEVELSAHDYLINQINYAVQQDGETPKTDNIYHNIVGVASQSEAVCDGYSKMYSLMLNCAGIDNVLLVGYTSGGDHAWNAVKTESKWYLTDTTWDDMQGKNSGITYEFFNMPLRIFNLNHTPSLEDYENYVSPEIASDFSNTYYKKFGGFISSDDFNNWLNGNKDAVYAAISAATKNYSGNKTNYVQLFVDYDHNSLSTYFSSIANDISSAGKFADNTVKIYASMINCKNLGLIFTCTDSYSTSMSKDVTLTKNGTAVGTFYTVAGALAAITDNTASYNIILSPRSDKYNYGSNAYPVSSQYTVFPKASITITGSKYNGKNAQLQFMYDVTIPSNITLVNTDVTSYGSLSSEMTFKGSTLSCNNVTFKNPLIATSGTLSVQNSVVEFDNAATLKNILAVSSQLIFSNTLTTQKTYKAANLSMTNSTLAFYGSAQNLSCNTITANNFGYNVNNLSGRLPQITATTFTADKISATLNFATEAEKSNTLSLNSGTFITTSSTKTPTYDISVVTNGTAKKGNCSYSNNSFQIFETPASAIDMSSATVSNIIAQTYLGTPVTPLVNVTLNGKRLLSGRDFKISYTNNVNVGTAGMTITGYGKYSGIINKNFTIKARTSSTLMTPLIIGRQRTPYTAVFIWRPDFNANGFEVTYGYKSDFSDAKVSTVEGYGVNLLAIQNLSTDSVNGYDSSKTLYAKIRSFYYDKNGNKVFSSYSATRYISSAK